MGEGCSCLTFLLLPPEGRDGIYEKPFGVSDLSLRLAESFANGKMRGG
jgi:hypothetical protein